MQARKRREQSAATLFCSVTCSTPAQRAGAPGQGSPAHREAMWACTALLQTSWSRPDSLSQLAPCRATSLKCSLQCSSSQVNRCKPAGICVPSQEARRHWQAHHLLSIWEREPAATESWPCHSLLAQSMTPAACRPAATSADRTPQVLRVLRYRLLAQHTKAPPLLGI